MAQGRSSRQDTQAAIAPSEAAQAIIDRREARRGLIDFCTFTLPDYEPADHLQLLATKLEAIERGELKRLMVFMPPQHGKSEMASVRFPAWCLGRDPTRYIVQASYAESLALFHSRQTRDIVVGPTYKTLFPNVIYRPETQGQVNIPPPRQAAHEWGAMAGGSYYAVGVGGGLTGRGMDIGIIDDPIKDAQEAASKTISDNIWHWYTMVFRTRVRPNAAIILIMTRWNMTDLAGRLLAQQHEDVKADKWEVLHLPAIKDDKALWQERYSKEDLIQTRDTIGSRAFESLYQGNPVAAEGNVFKREWWKSYKVRPEFKRLIQSWDTAFKKGQGNDYSVYQLWGETETGYYLVDQWRERVEFPELEAAFVAAYNRDKPQAVLVEDAASGQSLIQRIQRITNIPVLPQKVDKDKVARANAVTPLFESGRVCVPEYAPWLFDYIEELSAFPNGEHDDQVDATTQALNYLSGRVRKEVLFI